jgi:cytochrome P450
MSEIAAARPVAADELDLPFMPIASQELANDPMPFLEAARAKHPWLARCEVGYVVHAYQAMKDIMWMDDKLASPNHSIAELMGAAGTPLGRFLDTQIFALAGEEHTRVRSSVAEAFTPRNVNRYRGLMRQRISDLLDDWAPRGRFDMAEFASYFPITIACGLIGAPTDRIPELRHSLETMGLIFSLDPSMLPALQEAYGVLWDFTDGLIRARQANPGGREDDLLSALVEAVGRGQLSDVEVRNLLIFLFVAGYDTSKNMLTLLMYSMLDRPRMWERCAEDPAYCSQVVEEQFRFRNVATSFRSVAETFDYRGVQIPQGTLLAFPLPLAGRDPESFPDPDAFKPEREHANRHMAFGRGMHICLGQHLAKAQIDEAAHVIAQRITRPKLDGEVAWRPFPGAWGLRTLPITFTPGPRRPAAA